MSDTIESTILSTLQTIFDQFGWAGVFVLMTFENATGITPSEIILAFAGWMLIERHGISPTFIPIAGIYAGLGSALGASIAYWVARLGGRPVVDRFARYLNIEPELINKSEDQMHRWGPGLVLIGRCIPGIRTLISIPAGLAKVPFVKFFAATFIGAYVWCTLFIGAGYILGHEWMLISHYIETHLPLVFSLGILAMLAFLAYQFRNRIKSLRWFAILRNVKINQ